MKKIIIITALSLCLIGCGTKTVVVEKEPEITSPPITEQYSGYTDDEETYLSVIDEQYPSVISSMGEKWVVDFGKIACSAIDDGLTLQGIAMLALENNVDPEMLGFLIGAAIPTFCPRNMWFINNLGA